MPAMHSALYDWGYYFCFTDENTQAWKGKDLSQIETGSVVVEIPRLLNHKPMSWACLSNYIHTSLQKRKLFRRRLL